MIEQIVIAVFGLGGVWCAQDQRYAWRRWSCVFGLCAEPFWLWSAIKAQQWGVVVMVFLYTAAYVKGVRGYWIRKDK